MKTFILIEKTSDQEEVHDLITNIRDLVRLAGYYTHHEEACRCLELIVRCTETLDVMMKRLTMHDKKKVTLTEAPTD